jgi:hypothetical protein
VEMAREQYSSQPEYLLACEATLAAEASGDTPPFDVAPRKVSMKTRQGTAFN